MQAAMCGQKRDRAEPAISWGTVLWWLVQWQCFSRCITSNETRRKARESARQQGISIFQPKCDLPSLKWNQCDRSICKHKWMVSCSSPEDSTASVCHYSVFSSSNVIKKQNKTLLWVSLRFIKRRDVGIFPRGPGVYRLKIGNYLSSVFGEYRVNQIELMLTGYL